jgi:hypothetical protein
MKVNELITKLNKLNQDYEMHVMSGWNDATFYEIKDVKQFTDQCADFCFILIDKKERTS